MVCELMFVVKGTTLKGDRQKGLFPKIKKIVDQSTPPVEVCNAMIVAKAKRSSYRHGQRPLVIAQLSEKDS